MDKEIVDLCSGGRMFWYDKKNPNVHFMDNRILAPWSIPTRPNFEIAPDELGCFTNTRFENNTFSVVVMDPPHLSKLWNTSRMAKKYGKLPKDWRDMITNGFNEAMRILKPYWVFVFKWNEVEIPLERVLDNIPFKPSLWQRTGKNNKTVWLIYIKWS